MAANINTKDICVATQGIDSKAAVLPVDPIKIEVLRLPADHIDDIEPANVDGGKTTLHVYHEHGCAHKLITPTISPSQERRWGPKLAEQKARRLAKKEAKQQREASQVPALSTKPPSSSPSPPSPKQSSEEVDESYFLHTPYLSFHLPPSVLYAGPSKYWPAQPVALIHTACFWHSYKIQLGASLSLPGVLDPRGVVSRRHNSDPTPRSKHDAEAGKSLKGYRVRGWRLWGETGKKYVHSIRDKRRAGVLFDDPDVFPVVVNEDEKARAGEKVRADEVVYLTWLTPLSHHTRCYAFHFRGVEFRWKGTGTVKEGRRCGWMVRFCHLKLVARVPCDGEGDEERAREVCLGKYTCSIAEEKSGMLEIFDRAVLRFVEECMPGLLKCQSPAKEDVDEIGEGKITWLKKGALYHLIVATVLCMVNAEKEKRHTLIDLIIGAGENAGSGG